MGQIHKSHEIRVNSGNNSVSYSQRGRKSEKWWKMCELAGSGRTLLGLFECIKMSYYMQIQKEFTVGLADKSILID